MILLLLITRLVIVSSLFVPPPTDVSNRNQQNLQKADELSSVSRRQGLLYIPAIASAFTFTNLLTITPALASGEEEEIVVYQLASGVQFRTLRTGSGPTVLSTIDTDDSDDKETNDPIVVLHLRAMTSDGVLLFDTVDNNPILYRLGTSQNYDVFGGDSSKRLKVTQGVEDTIVSRGTTVGIKKNGILTPTQSKVEAMKEGGIRRVIVPAALAYGHAGVSRYDAFRMGLKNPVPRDQDIVYDIEVLRCSNVEIELPSSGDTVDNTPKTATIEACCSDANYPCKGPT